MSEVRERKKSTKADDNTKEREELHENAQVINKPPVSPRVFARIIVLCSLFIIFYYTSKNRDERLTIFAKQSEYLPGKGKTVECSPDYMLELNTFKDCFPRECGRFVTDQVISEKEADDLLQIAIKGLKFGGSSGGASILDLHSGALSKGNQFVDLYKIKQAKNLFTTYDFNIYRVVKEKIKYAIAHHFSVYPDKIFLTYPTFFSRLSSENPKTIHDEYWHAHVDKETYKSFHYTTLLYLNNYNKDFKGGRFMFIEENANRTVEPRKGRLSMFTSGAENTHFVERVTEGVRYAVTISFTCDDTYNIEDPTLEKFDTSTEQ